MFVAEAYLGTLLQSTVCAATVMTVHKKPEIIPRFGFLLVRFYTEISLPVGCWFSAEPKLHHKPFNFQVTFDTVRASLTAGCGPALSDCV